MLGQAAIVGAGNNPSASRVFVYEVAGIRQTDDNDKNNYQFRQSSNVFIKVAYNRMNDEMRRITRMGGTIVSIQPVSVD